MKSVHLPHELLELNSSVRIKGGTVGWGEVHGGTWWILLHAIRSGMPTGLPSPPGSCLVFSGTFFARSLSVPMPVILSHLLLGSLRNYAGIQGSNKAMQNSALLCALLSISPLVCVRPREVCVCTGTLAFKKWHVIFLCTLKQLKRGVWESRVFIWLYQSPPSVGWCWNPCYFCSTHSPLIQKSEPRKYVVFPAIVPTTLIHASSRTPALERWEK